VSLRYLTFDCYGTLVDWKTGIETNFSSSFQNGAANHADVFKRYALLEAREEKAYRSYEDILQTTSLNLAKQLGLSPNKDNAVRFANGIANWPAFEDTPQALRDLGKRGYKRVILSNIDRDLLQDTIKNNNLEIDGYVTAEDVRSYKPEKNHWTQFFQVYKVQIDEVIHVANSIYHDIIPATELGIRTVWVNRYNEPLPEKVEPSYVVSKVSDLIAILP